MSSPVLPDPGEMACRELVELVTAYLEDALPVAERERFDSHLRECEPCRIYIRQIEATIRAIGASSEGLEEAPPIQALLEVFRDWKRGSTGPATELGPPA